MNVPCRSRHLARAVIATHSARAAAQCRNKSRGGNAAAVSYPMSAQRSTYRRFSNQGAPPPPPSIEKVNPWYVAGGILLFAGGYFGATRLRNKDSSKKAMEEVRCEPQQGKFKVVMMHRSVLLSCPNHNGRCTFRKGRLS